MDRKHEEKRARHSTRRRGTGNVRRIGLESVGGGE